MTSTKGIIRNESSSRGVQFSGRRLSMISRILELDS